MLQGTRMKHRVKYGTGLALGLMLAQTPALADAEAERSVLSDIVVSANRDEAVAVGGSVQLIDTEELERFLYTDVNRVLRQVPGVTIQEEEGFGLRPNIGIRGSGSDRSARVALMEDGTLIAPAPYAAPAAYYFPSVARMSLIEVTKGPAAIKYGPQTIGGAVNMFSTPIPEVEAGDFDARLQLLGGNFGSVLAHGSVGGWASLGGGIEVGGLVEGLYDHSEGFKRIDHGGPTGYSVHDFVGKFGLRSADHRHQIIFKYQRFSERSNETYLGLTQADFQTDPYRRYNGSQADIMDVDHSTYQLSLRSELSDAITLTAVAYRHATHRGWYKLNDVRNSANTGWVPISTVLASPATYATQVAELVGADGFVGRTGSLRMRDNNRGYRSQGVQAVLAGRFATGSIDHEVQLSARYHEDSEDRFQRDDRYTMVNGAMVQSSIGAPGSNANRLAEANAWAFFAQDTMKVGSLTLVPGIRHETIDLLRTDWGAADPTRSGAATSVKGKVDVWIPGISASYEVLPGLYALAGVNRGFSSPAPGSTADVETSWNYEAGLRYARGATHVEAIGFFTDYGNLVGSCTASTGGDCNIGDQFDGGEVDVKGIEFLASHRFGSSADTGFAVPVALSYTYTDATFRTSFASSFEPWGNVIKGDRLPYLPRHQATLTVGLELDPVRFDARFNWVGKARAVAGQGVIPDNLLVDDRLIVDLSAEAEVIEGVSLFGSVQNIFDKDYNVGISPAGFRPGAPRIAKAGIKAGF